jgi:hypothetical protein
MKAAHPTGTVGEAYAVGTEESNVVYIWDVDKNDWVNMGVLQGPAGPRGEKGEAGADGAPGASGVYIGKTEPTDSGVNVWIDPSGTPDNEEWVFTMEDDSTVTKTVVVQ